MLPFLYYLLLLCDVCDAGNATSAIHDEGTNPTTRRMIVLVVVPFSAAMLYVGLRTYYPNFEFKEPVPSSTSEPAQTQKVPGWWEGGALGSGKDIQNLPKGDVENFLQEARKDEENEVERWVQEQKQHRQPKSPIEQMPQPSEITNSWVAVQNLQIQEEVARSDVQGIATEEWWNLARERDLGKKKVEMVQRRDIEEEEATVRKTLDDEQEEFFTHHMMVLWSDMAAKSSLQEQEVDMRYTVIFEEASERRGIAGDEFEMRIFAATHADRADIETEQATQRKVMLAEQLDCFHTLLKHFDTGYFETIETLNRQVLTLSEQVEKTSRLTRFVAISEQEVRTMTMLEEVAEGHLLECIYEGAKIMRMEEMARGKLKNKERETKRVLTIVQMVVVVDGAIVRAARDRKSQQITRLERGTVVNVEEIQAGRALLSNPRGWVSIKSQAGMAILELLEKEDTKKEESKKEAIEEPLSLPPLPPSAQEEMHETESEAEPTKSPSPPNAPAPAPVPAPVATPKAQPAIVNVHHETASDVAESPAPRSPTLSYAGSTSTMGSNLIDDFCEVVLHKDRPEQKIGICFATGSRLVLEHCIDGSASQICGLDRVLGHRLIKINGTRVTEKSHIAPFAREETLHLMFSKAPDPGWNAHTQKWKPRTSSPSAVAGELASATLSGLRGLRKVAAQAMSQERPSTPHVVKKHE